jgi:molybdopterin converting factor small subunit
VTVEVELFGNLAARNPRRQIITLAEPATAGDIAARLGVDLDSIGLVMVNGVQSDLEDYVSAGCRLCLFPPLSGG